MLPPLLYREAVRDTQAARARLSSLSSVADGSVGVTPAGWPPDPVPEAMQDAEAHAVEPGPSPRRGVPSFLREARLVAPRQAVAGLLVVALLSAVVTAVALWRVRPRAVPVGPPPVVGSATPGTPRAVPSPAARPLVLAVVGRVKRPGLVTVPAGSRLIDALRAAGGALPGVDLTPLNLARRVADGEQIVVGAQTAAVGVAVPGTASPGPAAAVNLNSATLAELDALPGVGPVIAQRILDFRSAHGGSFTSIDQLRQVSGIGDRTLERLRGLVTI